jgi:hypothetical protein
LRRLALLVLLLLPSAAPAQEVPSPTPSPTASPAASTKSPEAEIDEWHQTLVDAQDRREKARARAESALYRYRDSRQRHRRGPQRAALLAEMEAAEQGLGEAEAELAALLEEARRAGVPPGVLREFEN